MSQLGGKLPYRCRLGKICVLIRRLRDFKLQMVPVRHATKEPSCRQQQILIVLCDMRRPQNVPDRPVAIDLFEQLSFNRF